LRRASAARLPGTTREEEFSGPVELKELRNLKPASGRLSTDFYQLLTGSLFSQPRRGTRTGEGSHHRACLKSESQSSAAREEIKEQWPEAKTSADHPLRVRSIDYYDRSARIERDSRSNSGTARARGQGRQDRGSEQRSKPFGGRLGSPYRQGA